MSQLNQLEKAVLQEMQNKTPSEANALDEQIRHVTAIERNNTGSGFYTYMEVKSSDLLINSRVISNVFAKIEGMKHPMAFVLFIRNGKINMLEGATIEDFTFEVDFSTVNFLIV